ncbi:MAG: hypothetical protein HLUCCX10_03425 [Algoriphagus marincola HL-49]|uniref:Lipoprotein n=1 Tax=Algoriphagus marincola HL-49 TaxID=1305737 RepID=A0A0P7YJZ4_9BACT|nr:MAG: hypothetical protein HLUCCX10_03425 [Algoriphagus marincola HL-49]
MKSNKTLFHFSLLLLYVVFAVSCASMKNPSLIYYTDQNNNSFTISPSSLTYQGTKIENSSSGLYSGGKDRQIKISRPIFEKIHKLAETLLLDTSNHAERREMRTAILQVGDPSAGQRVMIYPSAEREKLEELLSDILKDRE